MWPFARKVRQSTIPLTLEQLQSVARENRAERRRADRQLKINSARSSARVCWRCGFGALKGIPNSNIVRMKDNEGTETWGHAQPTVCAGAVRAITAQARMSVKEALIDFAGISWATFRSSKLAKFLTEDSRDNRRGSRIRENTRVNPHA